MERPTRDYVPYLAAALSGALLIFGAAGYLFWKDAGELSAAAIDMGVPHPTGFPLWTGGARVFSFLPLGTLDLRFALFSALPLMLCVMILSALIGQVFRDGNLAISKSADLFLRGVALPLLVLSSDTAHYLASTPEVYALGALLALAQLWALFGMHGNGTRNARATGALVGLAPSAHVTAGMGFLAAFLARVSLRKIPAQAETKAFIKSAALPFALALAGVWALVFTAGNNPELNFGNPDGLGPLLQHLTGASIHEAFSGAGAKGELLTNLGAHGSFLFQEVGLVSIACAFFAFSFHKENVVIRSLWILVLMDLAYSLWLNPMGRVDLQTGLLSVLGLSALGCVGLANLALLIASRWKSAQVQALGPSLAVLVLLIVRIPSVQATWHDRQALRHDDTALQMQRDGLHPLNTASVVFTNSDNLVSTTLAARLVEGRRPDLTQIITPYAWWPWRVKRLGEGADLEAIRKATDPQSYSGLAPTDLQQRAIMREWLRWANRNRAIAWEAGAPIFEDLLGERLHPGFPFSPVQAEAPNLLRWQGVESISLNTVLSKHSWSGAAMSDGLRVTATVAARKGDLKAAIRWNLAAVGLNPQNGRALGNLGFLQLRDGRKEDALQSLQRAKELRPEDPRIWRNLGLAYYQMGEIGPARSALSRAKELARTPDDMRKAEVLWMKLGL